jgi:nitroreductase
LSSIQHPAINNLDVAAYLTGNVAKIRKAPLTAVFLADLGMRPSFHCLSFNYFLDLHGIHVDPLKSIHELIALETGVRPDGYLAILPALLEDLLGRKGKDPVEHEAEVRAWAYKNTAFAAQTYMLSAAALGLRACPMEGFESSKVATALKIPERYGIPLVIATGYSTPGARMKVRARFPVSEMCFNEEFGNKL